MTSAKTNIHRREIHLEGRRIVVFDLLRVDADSLLSLDRALHEESFDAVAVELDEQRRIWLAQRDNPEALNLLDILRSGQGARLGSYLALRTLQKRLGSFDGAEPGDEMEVALDHAAEKELPVHLVDRNMETTGLRAWRSASRWQRLRLTQAMAAGPFRRTRPREDAETRQGLDESLTKLRSTMPTVGAAFVDERSEYIAASIASIDENAIAVVLSSTQADDVAERLAETSDRDVSQLEFVPPKSLASKLIPWIFSVFIVALFAAGFVFGDTETLREMAWTWAMINIVFTSLATTAALAHPGTVIAAGLSSPLVSLNPAVGAGLVGAIIQSLLVPPGLAEIDRLGDDITRLRGWWQNRLARIALIFVFANLGSTIATFVALAMLPGMMGA